MEKSDLLKIANSRMPFGKYKGRYFIDLPEHYVVWFYSQVDRNDEISRLIGILYEVKLNCLESLINPLRVR